MNSKTVTITVECDRNWAGAEYLTYSTSEHGNIVELDFPAESVKEFRVFCLADGSLNYTTCSSLEEAKAQAEKTAKDFLSSLEDKCDYRFKYITEKDEIEGIFSKLPEADKVEILVGLYYKLTDAQKDRFLEETENS